MPKLNGLTKGDFLTFGSIGAALGMDYDVTGCEIQPGVFRRFPTLGVNDSRSDISRDGYIGVMFNALVNGSREKMASRIIKAGWRLKWTMGKRGNFDYVNIWPLIPYLYAMKYGKWIPTPPVLIIGKAKTGFRAHLAAMIIVIDLLIGKPYSKHKSAIKRLQRHNPTNKLFGALGGDWHIFEADDKYDWGGCTKEMHYHLTVFVSRLVWTLK